MKPTRYTNGSAMTIAGLSARYNAETMRGIPALWQQFGPRVASIGNMVGKASFGVVDRLMKPGSEITYMAGVQVSDIADLPPDFTAIQVPARKYAVFTPEGHVSEMTRAIGKILDEWLPASGHRIDRVPELIELYSETFNPETGRGGMEILLPIKE